MRLCAGYILVVLRYGYQGGLVGAEWSTSRRLARIAAHRHRRADAPLPHPRAISDEVIAALELARRRGPTLFEVRTVLDDVELRGKPACAALNDVATRFPTTSTWPELARAQALLQRTDPTIR